MSVLSGVEFKGKFDHKFYKVLANDLIHHGFKYQIGINVDLVKFNPTGTCRSGGLYFTDIKNILRFTGYGNKIGCIEILDDSMIYVENQKFKADKLVLSEIIDDEKVILKLLKVSRENQCPWNQNTCASAALNGHLEVLRWARKNGCPWDENTCAYAALNGHLKVLRWAREYGCPWNEDSCSFAAENGHLDVLQWASENGCECHGEYH